MATGLSAISAPPVQAGRLTPAVSALGRLYLERRSDAAAVDATIERRLEDAFARGPAQGVLRLGAAEIGTPLPPAFGFFRDLGARFVAALCRLPDLEERREWAAAPVSGDEMAALASAVPPITGAEYVTPALLERLWQDLRAAWAEELAAFRGTVQAYLQTQNAAWNLVGRVCFHLAENKRDEEAPFAFLATYTTKLSRGGRVQHLPLGRALEEYAGEGNRDGLLALLRPVQRAAERSELLRDLVGSRAIFHPLRWRADEAYRFLKDIPTFEDSGVVVRVPDFWRARRPPRPQVSATVGRRAAAGLGLDAMLDFSVDLTLDGERLTDEEWRQLLAGSDGLVLLRGRWVEVNRDELRAVLERFRAVQKKADREGLTFAEGLRLLTVGAVAGEGTPADPAHEWTGVSAGPWLAETLRGLRHPDAMAEVNVAGDIRGTLRPYQQAGLRWLWMLARLGLGGCLADDMGLGKTLQVLALFLALRRNGKAAPHLLVVPASLVANWVAEAERFAPSLRLLVAHPSAIPSRELANLSEDRLAGVDVVVTSYGTVPRLPWMAERRWHLVVLDEAQAIKNPGAKQTRAAKALRSESRLALTGTPVENHLVDLWSIFDFVNPGLLGTGKEFGALVKRLEEREHDTYAPLRNLVGPYILRRLKTDKSVISDLPEKTEIRAYCSLSKQQAALYQQSVEELARQVGALAGIKRRGVVLAFLMRLKQICNHPSHWLGDGAFDPEASGKFARLRELGEVIAAKQEKVLVFTQFREMTDPLAAFLASVFGRPGLVLHGETEVRRRKAICDQFQDDPDVPFFVLSLKAGGTGLNLTGANHVIHFDRWWNPAVEDQATDRAFRIGQHKNVLVHKFVCRGTVEERIDRMIEEKQALARDILRGGGEQRITELDDGELLALVALDLRGALAEN
jgi:non-specific serine/threonine protein kinase